MELAFFPPAGSGSLLFETMRLKSFLLSPFKDACDHPMTFGGHYRNGHLTKTIDGFYTVCMDTFPDTNRDKCLIYSFGINYDWKFDDDLHTLGCAVYSFDPSMKTASHQRGKKHHFYNWALQTPVKNLSSEWLFFSLPEIRAKLNHTERVIDVLKIDADGAELDFLGAPGFSERVRNVHQVIMEIHYMSFLETTWMNPETVNQMSKLLHLLEKHGFVLFYSRQGPGFDFRAFGGKEELNNSTRMNYEVSFLRQKPFRD